MTTRTGPARGGFTLVEMLVVVAIIGILAAILIPTIYGAINAAKVHNIVVEIEQMDMAVKQLQTKTGATPPNFSRFDEVVRYMKKAFPRHQENLITVFGGDADADGIPDNMPDASEALVFWLSRVKDDPRYPLSGPGTASAPFPFVEARLKDLDGDGWPSYIPPDGKDAPYVYFSPAYSVARPLPKTPPPTILGGIVYGDDYYMPGAEMLLLPFATTSGGWANAGTFQIISAGLDGDFGAYDQTDPQHKTFPSDFSGDLTPFAAGMKQGDLDNIANFSAGKKFEDHFE
jgi:prepilin-type N-terminal cleavage/methylation domain-containing protein